jgi:hypothetical protein
VAALLVFIGAIMNWVAQNDDAVENNILQNNDDGRSARTPFVARSPHAGRLQRSLRLPTTSSPPGLWCWWPLWQPRSWNIVRRAGGSAPIHATAQDHHLHGFPLRVCVCVCACVFVWCVHVVGGAGPVLGDALAMTAIATFFLHWTRLVAVGVPAALATTSLSGMRTVRCGKGRGRAGLRPVDRLFHCAACMAHLNR